MPAPATGVRRAGARRRLRAPRRRSVPAVTPLGPPAAAPAPAGRRAWPGRSFGPPAPPRSYVLRYYAPRNSLPAMPVRTKQDDEAPGRLNDPPVLILTSLASGPKHGYALLQDIEAFAGARLGPGTLYGAIARLEERGLIEPDAPAGRRRPYRLTAAGAEALETTLAGLRAVVDEGTARLRASGGLAARRVAAAGGMA